MAEGPIRSWSLRRFGEEHLQCTICQELYKEPKTLSCFHTFCKKCLLTYQKTPMKKTCPVCRKVTVPPQKSINNITTDFNLVSMVETVLEDKKLQIPICSSHAGKECWIYCETCNDLICLTCVTESHSGHRVEEVSKTVVAEKRQSVKDHVPKYEHFLTEITQALDTISQIKRGLQTSFTTSWKEVEDKATEEIAKVNAAKQLITDELKEIKTSRELKLTEYRKDLTLMKRTLQNSFDDTKHALQTCNNFDFLKGYPELKNGFQFLNACEVPQFDTRLMKFKPSKAVGEISLGRVTIQSNPENQSIDLLSPKATKWVLSPSGIDCGGRGTAALPDGTIIVADPLSENLVIFPGSSMDGVITPNPNRVRDVSISAINQHVIVVDDTNFVKMCDESCTYTHFKFATVPACEVGKTQVDLRSVAVKEDGTIIIGDVKMSVLTEHSPRDGTVKRVVPVETPPEFLAVNKESKVLVSGEYSGTVEMIEATGATVLTITPLMNDFPVRCCTGVCWSKTGIYIAMHNKIEGSGHVHHYDTNGRFTECVVQDLQLPQGIRITKDEKQIIVADYYSIKTFEWINALT